MQRPDVLNLIHDDLIFFDHEATTFKEMIGQISGVLHDMGYVKKSYGDAVIEREKVFPTGLETKCFPVAIPHADRDHVIQNAIAIIRLKNPITFTVMATADEFVEAQMVFILAIKESEGQLNTLKNFMAIFSDDAVLFKLRDAESPAKAGEIIRNFIRDNG
ncbi:MAG: PTS sugar transporter subunit IIA [Clostridiales Family XIII bacterium]|nr:PTS sugar transporter subunit IIA [Clostridiales Family XIII bacterium]